MGNILSIFSPNLYNSSIRITLDIYGHLMKETNGHAADKLSDLALSGSKMVANHEVGVKWVEEKMVVTA